MRENQHREIGQLDNEIKRIRGQQAAELDKMKVHLITEHQRFQQESNEKITEIARAAYKESFFFNNSSLFFLRIDERSRLWGVDFN